MFPRQAADSAVADLVEPQRDGRDDEEQRELDGDRQHENELIHALNRARRADALERLPAEHLHNNVSLGMELSLRTLGSYLDELVRQEHRHEQASRVKRQTRDLDVRARFPVRREEVDLADAGGDDFLVVCVEELGLRKLECAPGDGGQMGNERCDAVRHKLVHTKRSFKAGNVHVRDGFVEQGHERHAQDPELESGERDILALGVIQPT